MNLEGGLLIDLYRDDDRVSRVEISSNRPFQAVNLLRDKSPDAALSAVSLMYNVCANAQAQAGLQACRQALGYKASKEVLLAQQCLVDLETLREHLWRIALEWPRLLEEGISSRAVLLSLIMNGCRQALFASESPFELDAALKLDAKALLTQLEALQAFVEVEVLASPLNEWLENITTAEALLQWVREGGSAAARFISEVHEKSLMTVGNVEVSYLPALDQEALLQKFQASDVNFFVSEPTWEGKCYETTSLARHNEAPLLISMSMHFGTGLLTRLVAKLLEVATLLTELKQDAERLIDTAKQTNVCFEVDASKSWTGIGQVEAARGHLVHWVEIDHGKVNDYRILAPTEWNFHPQGIAAQGLKTLPAEDDDELRRQAACWINAIDPCVGYELRLHQEVCYA